MECILGTFGSGKTTCLAQHATQHSEKRQQVLVVCPTEMHCSAFRALLLQHNAGAGAGAVEDTVADRVADTVADTVAVQSAPKLLYAMQHGETLETYHNQVLVDDADYPLGFRWSMMDLLYQLAAMHKPVLFTSRTDLTEKLKLASSVAIVNHLATAHRLVSMPGHAQFLRSLFSPHPTNKADASRKSFPALLNTLHLEPVRCDDLASSSSDSKAKGGARVLNFVNTIMQHGLLSADTVVLCNDHRICSALTEQAHSREMSVEYVRTNSNYSAGGKALVTTIPNFYGLSRPHVVLVLPEAHISTADLVEGCSRHTKSLTVLFNASAPPTVFVKALGHIAPLIRHSSRDVFVNWQIAPAEEAAKAKKAGTEKTIGALARSLTEHLCDGASIPIALVSLAEFMRKRGLWLQTEVFCLERGTHTEEKGSHLTEAARIELGRLSEALVLHQLGCPLAETEPFRESMADTAWHAMSAEAAWHTMPAEAAWHTMLDKMVTKRQGFVSPGAVRIHDGYFAQVQQRVRLVLMPRLADQTEMHINQSVTLHLPCNYNEEGKEQKEIEEYAGRPDLVGDDCILEIKHMIGSDLDSYAVVQAVLYTIATEKAYCLVYNAASNELLRINVSISLCD